MREDESARDETLVELIELVLQGGASGQQMRELEARMLASAEDRKLYLHHLNLHSALRRQFAFDAEAESSEQPSPTSGMRPPGVDRGGPGVRLIKWRWAAAAAVAAVVLIAAGYLQRPPAERPIAKVTGLSGSLQWTGAGGRVLDELTVGKEL
ncbi:MAG TPA: hypothetical protein VNA25_07575, partial [Phycisphaerae bacterium]|nr:hypothetical protein [Phycisphaerae bacterium]